MQFVSALLVLTGGVALLRWYDPFHLAVALSTIGSATLLWRWLRHATRLEDDEKVDLDDEPVLIRALRGGLGGTVLLCLLAGAVFVAERSPLYGWFYDRDLESLLEKIGILEGARAYDEVLRTIEAREASAMSSAAQAQLAERKVRALIQSAEQHQGEQRVVRLQTAIAEADRIGASDLRQVVAARLEAIKTQTLLGQVRLAVEPSSRGLLINVPDVLFQPGEPRLIEAARGQIRQIVELVNRAENVRRRVSVEGHADGIGGNVLNQRLSDDRAAEVAAALVRAGVHADRVTTRGFGSATPIAPNDSAAGRAKNRRVEVVLLEPGA